MRSLREIFEDYAHYGSDAGHGDKGSTHSYIETYEKILAPYRDHSTFMEIGLALGWSLKMWGEYFTNSYIVGADISIVFDRNDFTDNKFTLIEADATKPDFLQKLGNTTFDVILEDSSHVTNDQLAIFYQLEHRMNPGGLYIIEDLLALDQERNRYLALHDNVEIIDLRHVKGRFDDALVIIRF